MSCPSSANPGCACVFCRREWYCESVWELTWFGGGISNGKRRFGQDCDHCIHSCGTPLHTSLGCCPELWWSWGSLLSTPVIHPIPAMLCRLKHLWWRCRIQTRASRRRHRRWWSQTSHMLWQVRASLGKGTGSKKFIKEKVCVDPMATPGLQLPHFCPSSLNKRHKDW